MVQQWALKRVVDQDRVVRDEVARLYRGEWRLQQLEESFDSGVVVDVLRARGQVRKLLEGFDRLVDELVGVAGGWYSVAGASVGDVALISVASDPFVWVARFDADGWWSRLDDVDEPMEDGRVSVDEVQAMQRVSWGDYSLAEDDRRPRFLTETGAVAVWDETMQGWKCEDTVYASLDEMRDSFGSEALALNLLD